MVGSSGIGKSTALKILSKKLKPNLGRYDNPLNWQDVTKYFEALNYKVCSSATYFPPLFSPSKLTTVQTTCRRFLKMM